MNSTKLKAIYNQIKTYEKTIKFVGNTDIDTLKSLLKKHINDNKKLKEKMPYVVPRRQISNENKIYILNKKIVFKVIVFNIEGSKDQILPFHFLKHSILILEEICRV